MDDKLGLFSVEPAIFESQLDYLAMNHRQQTCAFEPGLLPSDDALQITITFDDGYLDNLTVAAPLLVDRGLPFSVFVTAEHIRNRRNGFLDPVSLRELASLPGVAIGAHGASHRHLTRCDDQALRVELSDSRMYLEDIIGRPVVTMSYPHGAVDQRVRKAAAEAGYCLAACSYADINRSDRDTLLLSRTEVLAGDTLRIFCQKLKGNWDWYRWRTTDPARL
ncbi:MAG: polysaccharide deacetylase family protein [Rhodocyclaceae bacterium]|nr:polysaccharide deacetylase family protein [Rhodocyclaceae bacterium]